MAFSDDVTRARYDHLAFAAQRHRSGHDGRADDAACARKRQWLLELGSIAVLEAELESLSMDGTSFAAPEDGQERQDDSRGNSGGNRRERESYKSCLEAMLDGHYDTLGERTGYTEYAAVPQLSLLVHRQASYDYRLSVLVKCEFACSVSSAITKKLQSKYIARRLVRILLDSRVSRLAAFIRQVCTVRAQNMAGSSIG